MSAKRTPCDLSAVLGRVATIVRLQLQPGVALHLELPAGPLPVVTDATMLTQILTNLGQNGARFTKQGFLEIGCAVVLWRMQQI